MTLSPVQEKIINTPGNLIVRASAGTGKTHTMVNKIAKEINDTILLRFRIFTRKWDFRFKWPKKPENRQKNKALMS